MHILLLGKYGQLGWELQRTLAPLGDILALDFPQIDLEQADSLRELIHNIRPQVIFNATAYTAVDRAESEMEIAQAINSHAPRVMAEEAKKIGAAIIHYSTDYVFDGKKGGDYLEQDPPNPLNMYGESKLEGERAIQDVGESYLILRTSWVYSVRRESFVTRVLEWSRKQTTLRIVSDQVSNPTWCRMLAEVTAQLLAMAGRDVAGWLDERRGIYHLSGSGRASRFEWAQAILEMDPRREEQIVQEVQPALTSEFPTPAIRPLHSALNCDHFIDTFGLTLPNWREALKLAMEAG
ncbi:MAG: dTDP-4-dehydrorhamnose reductase [Chloroflexi bacterium RBG_19FT_COMBO_55_16]|nr:MAG: dTDP-4-dehydrorhamnose reductase [Chloroflexi bacterium RBG_19FT_COMBO_55_16]